MDFDEQVLANQFAQCLANRDATHFQFAPEFVFRGDLQTTAILARGNPMANDLLDLVVQGNNAVLAAGRACGGFQKFFRRLGHLGEHNNFTPERCVVLLS